MSRLAIQSTIDGGRLPIIDDDRPSYFYDGHDGILNDAAKPVLPGKGDAGPDCQESIRMHCNHCDAYFTITSSCMLRTCPHCFRKWAAKEARVSSMRIWSGVSIIAPRRTGRRIVHCVVSFEASGDLTSQRKRALKELKRHGISGGMVIYHPFRDDGDGYVPDGYVHFHCIGLARGNISPGDNPEVIFKVIIDARRKDYRGYRGPKEISCTVFYLLTHCGIVNGRHALTWFGELSYNALSNAVLVEKIPYMNEVFNHKPKHRCPICGSDDVEHEYIMDWTAPCNPYYVHCGPP